jgi:hypothetical protein
MTRTVAATAVLAALATTIVLATQPGSGLGPAETAAGVAAAWALFALGAWLVRRLPVRAAVTLIALGGVVLPLSAALAPPRTSDDLYRYVWDGRVQAAGIDPYRYPPAAVELRRLRDPELWPDRSAWCVADGATDPETGGPLAPGCTLINRPTVRTIYPPVAQAYFLGVHAVSSSVEAMRLAAAGFVIATTLLLLVVLPWLGLDRRQAVLWAWCPLVALEAGNNGHVDVVAAFVTVAALVALARTASVRGHVAGGALLGLAVATKLSPALVLPAVLRRPPTRLLVMAGAALGTVVAVYLPHVVTVGPAVLGYLPGYLNEEGYASGSRFALLTLLLPDPVALVAAAAILIGVAVTIAGRSDPGRPWRGGLVMTGVTLIVAASGYPWYAILLVALVALDGRAEWLAVAGAGHIAVAATDLNVAPDLAQRLAYASAGIVVVAVTLAQRRRHGRRATGPPHGRRPPERSRVRRVWSEVRRRGDPAGGRGTREAAVD